MAFSKQLSVRSYFSTLAESALRCQSAEQHILAAVRMLFDAQYIYTMGVGKMGYIAGKAAASLRSIGLNAHNIDATECAHGDLGVIAGGVVVYFSKSGNSQELLSCQQHVAQRGTRSILITNNERSPLAGEAQVVINMNVTAEGDEYNILPLVSTEIALAVIDCIVAQLSSLLAFTPDKFAANHPAGQIGMNLNRLISDISAWRKRKPFVSREDNLLDAITAASSALCGVACVVDEADLLLGIVSDGDVRRALVVGSVTASTKVFDIMNERPKCISSGARMVDAYNLFEQGERKLIALPVVECGRCVGVMTVHDLF